MEQELDISPPHSSGSEDENEGDELDRQMGDTGDAGEDVDERAAENQEQNDTVCIASRRGIRGVQCRIFFPA